MVVGGSGRDLLIGGQGEDRLVGDAQEDILIAGYTKWDTDLAALREIMKIWTGTADFASRVQQLQSRDSADSGWLNATTISDDNAYDVLTGSSGSDWFLFNSTSGIADKATALSKSEEDYAVELELLTDADWESIRSAC